MRLFAIADICQMILRKADIFFEKQGGSKRILGNLGNLDSPRYCCLTSLFGVGCILADINSVPGEGLSVLSLLIDEVGM